MTNPSFTNLDKPTVVEGSVLVTNGEGVHGGTPVRFGHLYCLDAETGTERWRFRSSKFGVGSPLVTPDRVYLGTAPGYVYALDLHEGKQMWRQDTLVSDSDDYGPLNTPVLIEDKILVWSNSERDGRLVCLDADNGTKEWDTRTGASYGSLVPFGEDVVATLHFDEPESTTLRRIGTANGTKRWERTYERGLSLIHASSEGIIGEDGSSVFTLDPDSTKVSDSVSVFGDGDETIDNVEVYGNGDGVVVASREGSVFAFETDPLELAWETDFREWNRVGQDEHVGVVDIDRRGSTIYVMTDVYGLFALDHEGAREFRTRLGEPQSFVREDKKHCRVDEEAFGVAVDREAFYVTRRDETVYRFPRSEIQ